MGSLENEDQITDRQSIEGEQQLDQRSDGHSVEGERNMVQITDRDGEGSSKRRRGVTRGLSVQKRRCWTKKLDVVFHPTRNRIVGENAKDFKTEACVVVKTYSPVEHARWRDIPAETKRKMWLAMKQKFNLEETDVALTRVFEQLHRQFISYRHKLNMYYLKKKDDEDILDHPPNGIDRAGWKLLIDYFTSDEFQKVSIRNKQNRDHLKMSHSCGTKSIAQYCYEKRDVETGEEPTRTMAWKLSRYSTKKKDWIDGASGEVYDKLVKLQSDPAENGDGPLPEDEAFVKVLGKEKSSRLRGCGDGMKPPSKRRETINYELLRENEELRKQNEELNSKFESLAAKVSSQEANLQAQLQSLLKAQLPAILQGLNSNSQLSNSN